MPATPLHTRSHHARLLALLLALAASAVPARASQAQIAPRGRVSLGVVGGAVQFDMSGTGTTSFGAVRVDEALNSWLLLEQSVGVMRPKEQFTSRATYLVEDFQLQAQATLGHVRPYLGLGVGMVNPFAESVGRSYGVGSVSAGARTELTPALDLRTELRVSGVAATLAQWTVGLSRRL